MKLRATTSYSGRLKGGREEVYTPRPMSFYYTDYSHGMETLKWNFVMAKPMHDGSMYKRGKRERA